MVHRGESKFFCLTSLEKIKVTIGGKNMFGAILGDIIGSPYEFDRGNKSKDFPLFIDESEFTDDTVMTIAIAEALMSVHCVSDQKAIKEAVIKSMKKWGKKYPNAGYGIMFSNWLDALYPEPYGSFGNGSAMRVSSVAWLFNNIDEVREVARWTAEVSHNHPEGVKGAEATASAIFLARSGSSKNEIKDYIQQQFGYDLNRTCDQIRPTYHHVESCMETVPEAMIAFLEGNDFEDVIRNAVSLGGDCDTLTAIAGSIAEGYYGVPSQLQLACYQRLPDDLRQVLKAFEIYQKNTK